MAEQILSPGVFQNESDQSLVQRGIQGTATAIVGPTVLGQPFVPTYVTSYSEFAAKFGETFKSGSYNYEYFTSMAARDFFQNGGQTLLVTRIVNGSGSSAMSTYASASVGNQTPTTGDKFATGSGAIAAAFTANQEVRVTYGSTVYRFIAVDNTTLGPQDDVDGNLYYFATGSTAAAQATNVAAVINRAISGSAASASVNLVVASTSTATLILSGSSAGTFANGITVATGSASSFSTLITLGGGTNTSDTGNAFVLETLAWGNTMNNTSSLSAGALASGSTVNVRWEITQVSTGSGTFTLAIRQGNDNTAQPNYIETWPNLSLDPALPNFISRVIGDYKPMFRLDVDGEPYIDITGSYANASQYVRVKSVNPTIDSIDNNGFFKSGSLSGSLPALGSGSYGGSFGGGLTATSLAQLMNENITATNVQGFQPADYITAFNLLANKDDFRFNVLLAPGVTLDNSAVSTMISTCEGRGDAIAVVDTKLYGAVVSTAATAAAGQNSNYAATYWPWVQLFSSGLGKAVWAPPSTVMGGVYAFNDQVAASWFAPAGLNRGGVPSVLRAERKLSQNDRDTLYDASVNPLATFPGEGVVVFGQKTLQKKSTALDRVNVRRLLIALKDYIGQVANNLVFEQNTNVTRNRFLSQVNPYMESVVQRQGLYAYKVVMDESNNTPDVIDRNQLVGQIYIQPTKTAEFIILNFNVQPTGATFPA
jgi:phage tail sheath protein FI